MTPLFFNQNRWHDSWTYGDWRQFMCEHKDGSLQCARYSRLTPASIILGSFLFVLMIMLLVMVPHEQLIMGRVIAVLALGIIMIIAPVVLHFSGWALMHAVGPRQYGNRRILPGEVSK